MLACFQGGIKSNVDYLDYVWVRAVLCLFRVRVLMCVSPAFELTLMGPTTALARMPPHAPLAPPLPPPLLFSAFSSEWEPSLQLSRSTCGPSCQRRRWAVTASAGPRGLRCVAQAAGKEILRSQTGPFYPAPFPAALYHPGKTAASMQLQLLLGGIDCVAMAGGRAGGRVGGRERIVGAERVP